MRLEQNWRPTRYCGSLTAAQVAQGINACYRSAHRLLEDARILREHGRCPSATALAILAIEEAGKAGILRRIASLSDPVALKAAWRDFRSHRSKSLMWPLLLSVKAGARKLDDFGELHDPTSDHPELLDSTKQLCLYAECFNHAHWSEPDVVIDAGVCELVMGCAEVLCRERQVTETEIALWIERVGNLNGMTALDAKHALAAWYGQLQLSKIALDDSETFREFLGLPPDA